jgi:hypothetical protein
MSTLQIGLAIMGGLVLAGLVAYNAWVTSRSAPRTARERSEAPRDEAAGDETLPYTPADLSEHEIQRIDPVLGDMPGAPAPPDPAAIAQAAAAVSINPLMTQPPEKRPGLDALIDVIAPLLLEHEVSGDALLAALPGTRRVGSKPFAVEGLSETTGEWESPRLGQRYRALQAGVQLANRSGPLNDIEFSEFVVKAQAFADAVGASPDFPDMRAEVGFTLRARRTAWSPGYVAQHASKLGFVAGALPGRMVLSGSQSGQAPILSLMFDPQAAMAEDPEQTALREIALSLEVTHVPRSEQPFVRMRQAATALAEAMEGVVTDDGGQPLSTDTMDRIGADLESLYDALDSRDLSAGSPQARRLFS